MTLWILLLLAAVQGLTEFLPVSSSAHLVFVQSLFQLNEGMLFVDVFLHGATLLAVFIVFRADLIRMAKDGFGAVKNKENILKRMSEDSGLRMLFLIGVGSVPTAIIGLAFHDQFEALFSAPSSTAIQLMITGILLWFTNLQRKGAAKGVAQTTWRDAGIIGAIQGLAILPGISRSGATIFAALFLGLDRRWAAHYSFLLSIPAILGAILLESIKVKAIPYSVFSLLLAFGVALVFGVLSLRIVIRTVESGKFRLFSYYCLLVGALAWIYFTLVV